MDMNDNSPVFSTNNVQLAVTEDTDIGTVLYVAQATDKDDGLNGMIVYTLSNSSDAFAIDANLGTIVLQRHLAFRLSTSYMLTVNASDMGTPAHSTLLSVSVMVIAISSNAPIFTVSAYRFSVQPGLVAGTKLGSVSTSDVDTGSSHTYYWRNGRLAGMFDLDPGTGAVSTKVVLVNDVQNEYELDMVVVDTGIQPRSSTVSIYVTVGNNNNVGPLFAGNTLTFFMDEKQPPFTTVGFLAPANIAWPNHFRCNLAAADKFFRIIPETCELLNLIELDHDVMATYAFDVSVIDFNTPQRSAVVHVMVDVTDYTDSDNDPKFADNLQNVAYVTENRPIGSKVVQLIATDLDVGTNEMLVYSFPTG